MDPRDPNTNSRQRFPEHLKSVTENPDEEQRWVKLLKFPKLRLAGPTDGGKANCSDRIKQFRDKQCNENPTPFIFEAQAKTLKPTRQQLERRVRHRIDAGDIRGAVRLVINEGRIIEPDDASAAVLTFKHPAGDSVTLNDNNRLDAIEFTEKQLRAAIKECNQAENPDPTASDHLT